MKKKDVLKVPAWLDAMSGKEQEVILSSGIKIIRNIEGYPMAHHASLEQLDTIKNKISSVVDKIEPVGILNVWNFNKLTESARGVLYEKHACPFLNDKMDGMLLYATEDFSMRVLLNYKEHLQLGNIRSGLVLDELYKELSSFEGKLSEQLPFAFSKRYGYLSSNVTKTGTGLEATVVLHLPALVGMEKISKLAEAIESKNMVLERLYKDDTSFALGNLYLLRNVPIITDSEQDIVDTVTNVAEELMGRELRMRKVLYSRSRVVVENYFWRAVGIMKHTRTIQAAEMLALFSYIGLGIDLGLLEKIDWLTLKKLMVQARNCHLKMIYTGKDIEQVRATLLRAAFKEV